MQRVKTFLHRVHNFLTPPERRVGERERTSQL